MGKVMLVPDQFSNPPLGMACEKPLSVLNGFSQAIPNGGFENWSGTSITLPIIGTVAYEELDGWKSTNAITAALGGGSTVVKSPNSYSGTYSLQVGTIETQ